jgi:hypothetical protein
MAKAHKVPVAVSWCVQKLFDGNDRRRYQEDGSTLLRDFVDEMVEVTLGERQQKMELTTRCAKRLLHKFMEDPTTARAWRAAKMILRADLLYLTGLIEMRSIGYLRGKRPRWERVPSGAFPFPIPGLFDDAVVTQASKRNSK